MTDIDLKRALEIAVTLAKQAGALIRAEFHHPGGPRHEGSHHADVDREAEKIIRERLLEAFPEAGFVGEETGSVRSQRGQATWYVDPNDGTKSFIEGVRGSAVSIALVIGDEPVLGVVYAPVAPDDRGDLIAWAKGEPVRRNGGSVLRPPLASALTPDDVVLVSQAADNNSAANARLCAPARFRAVPSIAYRLALVAVGDGEAGISLNGPVHWDYAAGHALLRAVGGELVTASGDPVRYGSGGGDVFGGHVDVARQLARRRWSEVRANEVPQPPIARDYPLVVPGHRWRARDTAMLSRAQGCLLGQFSGDSLGALVEFRSAASIRREYLSGVRDLADGGTHGIIAGQLTDDSELALMLARSLIAKRGYDAAAVFDAYLAWRNSKPFDMGTTTSAALSGRPNATSQSNGALMRVSPLGVFGASLDPAEVGELARADAALTHPHPICRDASGAFAVAISLAVKTGAEPQAVYQHALDWLRQVEAPAPLETALVAAARQPPTDFEHQQGRVLTAFQNAFYELLHAPTVEEGIVRTVGRGGDTDTNAAIAGALLGAVRGRSGIPQRWMRQVLSCRPIAGVHPRPKCFWPVDVLDLAEVLLALGARNAAKVLEE